MSGSRCTTRIETIETLLACFKLRAVPINVNYRYGAEELRYLYDNADLDALVYHRSYEPAASRALALAPTMRQAIVVDDDLGSDHLTSEADTLRGSAGRSVAGAPGIERSADDLFMMYTGGTTGMPKGVMWRQEDMWRVPGRRHRLLHRRTRHRRIPAVPHRRAE